MLDPGVLKRVAVVGVSAMMAAAAAVVGAGDLHAAGTLAMCRNAGSPPRIRHIVVMLLENQGYHRVIGNTAAPYMNRTLTARCGVATRAFGVTHTSAANYLGVSAGQYPARSPSGCGSVAACRTSEPSLYQQMASAGKGWRDFVEGATLDCQQTSIRGVTKIGHDPGLFYSNVNCPHDVDRVRSFTRASDGESFWQELRNNSLRGFTWLSPNQTHVGEGDTRLAAQDNFLSQFVPKFVSSPAYQSGTTALVIAEDEGGGRDSAVGERCTDKTADLAGQQPSCHVPLWVVYPYNPGGNDRTFLDLYSLTKGVEDVFHLPYLGHAANAGTNSLVGHFGLSAG